MLCLVLNYNAVLLKFFATWKFVGCNKIRHFLDTLHTWLIAQRSTGLVSLHIFAPSNQGVWLDIRVTTDFVLFLFYCYT
jgi:hypothetical protein